MPILIDTNIAIYVRDDEPSIMARLASLAAPPQLSVVTRVELEGGSAGISSVAKRRRARLDELLESLEVHDFDSTCAAVYRTVIECCGYSRSRVLDRMIAATAIVHDLSLITINGDDFRDIPGLKLEIWPAPPQ